MFIEIMKSIENNFDDPKVNELLNKHFIELRSVSPEGSSHVLDIPGLKDPSIRFWSLWEEEELIGCGALKTLEPNPNQSNEVEAPIVLIDKIKSDLNIILNNYAIALRNLRAYTECEKMLLEAIDLNKNFSVSFISFR